ncbi:MAG: morphogenetic protein [Plesiomonas shigelloides]
MKERSIIFKANEVRATLAGTKTQFRRAIKAPSNVTALKHFDGARWDRMQGNKRCDTISCPHGQPGDRLWVQETFFEEVRGDKNYPIWYRATEEKQFPYLEKWRPSPQMPRWASRLTLEIVSVRVERLRDMSYTDAEAEGVRRLPLQDHENNPWWTADVSAGPALHSRSACGAYRKLWEQINGPKSWDKNPFVWVVEFKRVEQ